MQTVCSVPFYCANYEHVPPSHNLFPFKVNPWLFSSVWNTPPSLPKVAPNIYRPCAHRWGLMALQKSLLWAELELVLLYNWRGGNTIQAIHHPAISIRPQTDLKWTAQRVHTHSHDRTHRHIYCLKIYRENSVGNYFCSLLNPHVLCGHFVICSTHAAHTQSYVLKVSL